MSRTLEGTRSARTHGSHRLPDREPPPWEYSRADGILCLMNSTLRRLSRTLSSLVAEDRDGFKRVDASPARPDDGKWLKTC